MRALRDWKAWALVVPVALLVGWPLLQVAARTFGSPDGPWGYYYEALASPLALSAIWGSTWLTATTLAFGIPLAVVLAWITSSTDAPLARTLGALPTLTLALSPLVCAIGWMVLLSPKVGVLNLILRELLGLQMEEGPLNAFSLPVIVMLMTLYVVPYVYGPVHGALSQINSSLLEAARACGATPRDTLFTVTLPLLRPAILAGALIGAVMVSTMFAIPLILSSGTGLNVIPIQIYHYVNQESRPGPAMAMASLLTVVTALAMGVYFRVLGRGQFVTVGGKGSVRVRVRLGVWRWPVTAFLVLYLCLALVVPVLTLFYLSLVGFWSNNVFSQAINFDQYRRLVDFPSAMQGLFNSAWLSALAASIALLAGFTYSYRRLRTPVLANRIAVNLAALPLGVPSIVLGLAFLYTFSGPPVPLYGTPLILIAAYAVFVLPVALRNSDASLLRVSSELEEAGRVCGDTRRGVVWRILVPTLRQPLTTAWGLAFIILFRDLSMSILIYTSSTTPSSVALLSIFEQGWMTGAAAYSIIITLISAGVVALLIKSGTDSEAH